jgi:hypothetical protein
MLTQTTIDNANKGALRQLCRDNSIPYADLDVAGMRAALSDLAAGMQVSADATVDTDAEVAASEVQEFGSLPVEPQFDTPAALAVVVPATYADSVPAPVVQVSPRLTSKGLKIEKDREQRNGVKRPSAGGACRAVWDELDAAVQRGTPHTVKTIKLHADCNGWNVNNAAIEFYQWRKFNGISGRSPK